MNKSSSIWLFLIGLGYYTQFRLVGSIGISEVPIFIIAPLLFLKDFRELRYDGFMPILSLSVLCCIGCCVSSFVNSTPRIFFLKGFAHPYSIFAATVVLHHLLRRNFAGFKWLLVGLFLSSIISIFVFQQETYTARVGEDLSGTAAIDAVTDYALFWSHKIRHTLTLPVQVSYLSVPWGYSCGALFASAIAYIFLSKSSGRAAAATMLLAFVLIAMGGKSRKRIEALGKRFVLLSIILVAFAGVAKMGYSFMAKNGHLGDSARQKYYRQTRAGSSMLHILMAGRMEFFCGVMACFSHPILGFGPKGEDTEGFVARYLREYGAEDDYLRYIAGQQEAARRGRFVYYTIPAHSYIAEFWIYYGIAGLLVWIYVLGLFYCSIRRGWCAAIPQWYGFVCISIACRTWDIFFSPFATRVETPLLLTCLLFARQIKLNRMVLPYEMEMEARKYD